MNKHDYESKAEEFLEACVLKEKAARTIAQYKRIMRMFCDSLPDDQEIKKQDILNFKKKIIDDGFAHVTVNNYLTIVNSFFKYADLTDMYVKKLNIQQKSSLKNVLEPIDYKRLIRWAGKLEMKECMMIMQTLAETGIRISELKFFTVEAVQESPYIVVMNKAKIREVIMRNSLRKELKKYASSAGIAAGYIFHGREDHEKPASEATIWRDMRYVAGAAKVRKEKVHAHSFRHLFALRWISEGGSLTDLKDILGHTKIDTTAIYTMTTKNEKKSSLESMSYGRMKNGKNKGDQQDGNRKGI